MHGRSRMAMDPRIPTNAGDGTRWVFIDQADIASTKRENVRYSTSRMKGELHPTKNRLCGGLYCKWMTASN